MCNSLNLHTLGHTVSECINSANNEFCKIEDTYKEIIYSKELVKVLLLNAVKIIKPPKEYNDLNTFDIISHDQRNKENHLLVF